MDFVESGESFLYIQKYFLGMYFPFFEFQGLFQCVVCGSDHNEVQYDDSGQSVGDVLFNCIFQRKHLEHDLALGIGHAIGAETLDRLNDSENRNCDHSFPLPPLKWQEKLKILVLKMKSPQYTFYGFERRFIFESDAYVTYFRFF